MLEAHFQADLARGICDIDTAEQKSLRNCNGIEGVIA